MIARFKIATKTNQEHSANLTKIGKKAKLQPLPATKSARRKEID